MSLSQDMARMHGVEQGEVKLGLELVGGSECRERGKIHRHRRWQSDVDVQVRKARRYERSERI